MFFTKWQDTGEGRSYLDPKWQHHIDHMTRNQSEWEKETFEPGSLCAAFEQGDAYDVESVWTAEVKEWILRRSLPSISIGGVLSGPAGNVRFEGTGW